MVILNVVFHDGFNLSIGSNLKLAPVPCAIPEGYNGVNRYRKRAKNPTVRRKKLDILALAAKQLLGHTCEWPTGWPPARGGQLIVESSASEIQGIK